MKKTDPPIIVEQNFNVSKQKLWSAITDPDEMKQWYFEIMPDFKPEPGFKTDFHLSVEDRNYTHLWEVTEVIPQEKIICRWQYQEHPGDSYVTFAISEKNSDTILTVTCDVVEDFPQDLPEFKRQSGVDGWNFLIKNRLVEYLK